jgi:hypothetical protein
MDEVKIDNLKKYKENLQLRASITINVAKRFLYVLAPVTRLDSCPNVLFFGDSDQRAKHTPGFFKNHLPRVLGLVFRHGDFGPMLCSQIFK